MWLVAVAIPALSTCLFLGFELDRQARTLFASRLAANLETFSLVLAGVEQNLFDGVRRAAADNTLQITLDLEIGAQLTKYVEAQRQVMGIDSIGVYGKNSQIIAASGSGQGSNPQWQLSEQPADAGAACIASRDVDRQIVTCYGTAYLVSVAPVLRARDGNLGDATAPSAQSALIGYLLGATPIASAALVAALHDRRIAHPLIWFDDKLVYANVPAESLQPPRATDGSASEYLLGNTAYLGAAKAEKVGVHKLVYAVMAPLAPLQATLLRSLLTVAGIGLFLVVGTLTAIGLIANRLLRPIEQLRVGAARIGGGDLGQRIAISTGDEVEALADQFNEMAARLQESHADLEKKVESRTRELAQSIAELRALGEVSQAVNSTLDLETVLATIVAKAVQLSGTEAGSIYHYDEGLRQFHLRATYGMDEQTIATLMRLRIGVDEPNIAPVIAGRVPIQVADLKEWTPSPLNEIILGAGYRALLLAPLLRGEEIVGILVVRRRAPGPFRKSTVDLIQTFAAQSVLAVQNARLFENVEARTRELAASLEDLRTAQDRLIQTEKLASLGQLTAGIAHEIKNPLNFVNNFSALSVELIDEVQEAMAGMQIEGNRRAEVGEILNMLRGNLDKVMQHGKRADSIVKNMLLHSRQGSGERQPVDINAIVEESLNLAYHGARAGNQSFNITLEKSLDPTAGKVDLFPQEITRVLLNLIANGFYAATKRKAEANGADYEPTLAAATKNLGDSIEIRIRDNGTGIAPEVREKMFNPFFTTKPAGEGTGLGLSLSYDIIVKQHAGSMEVDSRPGEFTEFRIVLPRGAAAAAKSGGRS